MAFAVLAPMAARSARARSETFSKHVVVAGEGHAADVGREVLIRAETQSTPRSRRRLRWR